MSHRSPARPVPEGAADVVTLIDELLAEQRRLTAVEKFSQFHERQETPLLAGHYRDLIPLAAPRPGEQYAFEVDLDRCSGCKGCVSACHSLNGLDEEETWRNVGLLIGEAPAGRSPDASRVIPLQQTVTTACHHCVEPGCLQGCPVLAYDKDPLTGIVRHLDDQCIGCSYCILMCPYEVPKYSARRGIVRKCDLCHGRLAAGEAPACVQACPNEAIRITLVKPEWVRLEFRTPASGDRDRGRWLPDAPDPALTLPTTRYVTRHDNQALRAADRDQLVPQPAHWPLVWMLVLSQMGVGAWAMVVGLRILGASWAADTLIRLAWVAAHLGLAASVFHLGRPSRAWRAFLGWRTSWMSREILLFGGFSFLATGVVVAKAAGWTAGVDPRWFVVGEGAAAMAGFGAVAASAMIYVAARRPLWGAGPTLLRFLGTAALLGSSLAGVVAARASASGVGDPALALGLAWLTLGIRTGLWAWDRARFRQIERDPRHPAHPCVRVARGHFPGVILSRQILFWTSTGLGLLAATNVAGWGPGWAMGSLVSTFTGSILERWTFFSTSVAPRMPGLP